MALYKVLEKTNDILKNEGFISFFCKSQHYLKNHRKIRKNYHLWKRSHSLSQQILDEMKEDLKNMNFKPKISIITPVWNTNEIWLKAAIESVRSQIYCNWELCLIDDASWNYKTKKLLESYSKEDDRLKIKALDKNLGVAGASNEGISIATGDYIGFLDHDDELFPFTLYEIVKFLNNKPDANLIYSDEVLTNRKGRPLLAFYRPDFSLDYLLSHPYIVHFIVIKSSLVHKIGGFRKEFFVSQDYDLILRAVSGTKNICHIPKILYKWRQNNLSAGHIYKSQVMEFSTRALGDFLKQNRIDGAISPSKNFNFFRVKRKIRGNPKISIIIPIRDKINYLKKCLDSIENKTFYRNYEIIIIDNLSISSQTAQYLDHLKQNFNNYQIIKFPQNFNYSMINNLAAEFAEGQHLLFLNSDTEIINSEWLESMLEHSQRDEIACVGAKLLCPNKRIQHIGVVIGLCGPAEHVSKFCCSKGIGYMGAYTSIRNYSAVTGACMMVAKIIFEELGGFDENLRVGFGDIDFCLRARELGYENLFTPYAELYHYESGTRGKTYDEDSHPADTCYFMDRWRETIQQGDPYYNENLPLNTPDIELAARFL